MKSTPHSVMIHGTSSHAGKSVIVAGMCGVLSDMGYAVAPFKVQNISLNSYVTEDGCEIAIAQATQAYAALATPVVEMSPILLKPSGPMNSQLVVMSGPIKKMLTQIPISGAMKKKLFEVALKAFKNRQKKIRHSSD